MKKMLLGLLANLHKNCEGVTGVNEKPLREEVENIIDKAQRLPNDTDVERWKKDSEELSWKKFPDRMGQ